MFEECLRNVGDIELFPGSVDVFGGRLM